MINRLREQILSELENIEWIAEIHDWIPKKFWWFPSIFFTFDRIESNVSDSNHHERVYYFQINIFQETTTLWNIQSEKNLCDLLDNVIDCFDKSMLNYLCHFINAIDLDEYITGSAQPKFTQKALNELLIPLPPLGEQKRIVSKIENAFFIIQGIEENKSELTSAIKQAKSKILDLAIHGKLVPQDPNDEPAEELLKRIATSDNRPYKKFDDEGPFEIPDSWAWCYLHTISALLNGDRGENYPSKKDYVECGIPFINAGCLDNGNINYDVANYITEEKYNSLRAGKIQKGDILYCLRGSLGKTGFVITDNKGAISSSLCIFRLTEAIIPQYFLYVLNSNAIKVQQQMVDNGTAQPNLSAKDVSNYAIPIPPLTEQHRIVSKIEELFMLLDYISEQLA